MTTPSIPAAELVAHYQHHNLPARLVSKRNQEGAGKTWHLVFTDGFEINTFYDSSSRERFKLKEMQKIVRGLPFP
ncbi:hypothetical protein ANRL1_00999 [Anaerolineae bacterium]|nr:hypothetical protein ANRL1_00999 [Anaerolineae bacterium]